MKIIHHSRRSVTVFIFLILSAQWTLGQAATPPGQGASQDIQTQTIEGPPAHPDQPATLNTVTGSMQAEQVKELLKNVRFSEYRINDLLTDVHPEKWKMPDTALASFNQTLKSLREQVGVLEQWRAQFEQRTDSLYLSFQTYSTIDAVLPRLNGVTQSIAEHESAGYAAQFSRAGDRLFDLQQEIGHYVSSLMQSEDQLLLDYTRNMATCQQNLSAAMRGKSSHAKPMRNSQPIRPQRRRTHPSSATQGENEKKPQ
jgi:hypothetical protein